MREPVLNLTLLELIRTLYVLICYWLMPSLSSSSFLSMFFLCLRKRSSSILIDGFEKLFLHFTMAASASSLHLQPQIPSFLHLQTRLSFPLTSFHLLQTPLWKPFPLWNSAMKSPRRFGLFVFFVLIWSSWFQFRWL